MGERGHPHRGSRDTNEPGIIRAAVKLGASVKKLERPGDLLIGYLELTLLVEAKLPPGPQGGVSHSDLSKEEVRFVRHWRGQYRIIRTPIEMTAYLLSWRRWLQSFRDGPPHDIGETRFFFKGRST